MSSRKKNVWISCMMIMFSLVVFMYVISYILILVVESINVVKFFNLKEMLILFR